MSRFTNDAKWAPVIGRYMIAFGSIENSINELLRNVIPEGAMKVIAGLQLGQRIKLLREGLSDWKNLSDANQTVIAQNIDEVSSLSQTRNLIAHNPLLLSLFTEEGHERSTHLEHIRSETSRKVITLDELEAVTSRAEALADALMMNWIDYDFGGLNDQKPTLKRPK